MGSLDRRTSQWPYAAVGSLAGTCLALLLGVQLPLWERLVAFLAPPVLVVIVERAVRWFT